MEKDTYIDPQLPNQWMDEPVESTAPQVPVNKAKTSQRLRYEAEVEVIRRKIGPLESVRQTLGLSRRKICQLLLVDPSAWTRWTQGEDSAPPHIYRSLQWYLALIEKEPAWHPANSFNKDVNERLTEKQLGVIKSQLQQNIEDLTLQHGSDNWQALFKQLQKDKVGLEEKLLHHQQVGMAWKILLLINSAALLGLAIYKYL